jgi:toxin-antitoxin system PIN domain toxin
MKPCLADVNIWIALTANHHEHHKLVWSWYTGLDRNGVGLPRLVQLSVGRLLSTRHVQGPYTLSTREAWHLVQKLLDDERVVFLPEPAGVDRVMDSLLNYAVPTPKLLNDAYLAAFAICSGRQMVSMDKGFSEFRGLDLHLLEPITRA